MALASSEEKQDHFAEKISEIVTKGFLSLALAVGHKSGLFTTLASFTEPKTCEEICAAGGWKISYIKEWLGAAVAGGIIDVDSTGKEFFLPPHRHAALTHKTSGSDNFAGHAFGVVSMSKSFDRILHLMKSEDSNVPTDVKRKAEPREPHEHRDNHGHAHDHIQSHEHGHDQGHGGFDDAFMEWYMEAADDFNISHLICDIIPANEGLQELLDKGGKVLEIGCGSGVSTMEIAKKFPKATIVGIEVNEDALKDSRANFQRNSIKNVSFQVATANELPPDWTGTFDHVFAIKVMHHTIPSKALREILRVLTPGGTFTMVEIDSRESTLANSKLAHAVWLYMFSLTYFTPMEEMEGGHHHGSNFEHAGGDEGGQIRGFWWSKERIEKAIKQAGFHDYTSYKIAGSLSEALYVCKKKGK